MFARLLRLSAVLLAGLLLGAGAIVALVALGVVRNPLDPVIGGDIALARSARPGQRVLFVGNSLTTTTCPKWWGGWRPPIPGQSR